MKLLHIMKTVLRIISEIFFPNGKISKKLARGGSGSVSLRIKSRAVVFTSQNSGHSRLLSETSFLPTLVRPRLQSSGMAGDRSHRGTAWKLVIKDPGPPPDPTCLKTSTPAAARGWLGVRNRFTTSPNPYWLVQNTICLHAIHNLRVN